MYHGDEEDDDRKRYIDMQFTYSDIAVSMSLHTHLF